MSKRFCFLKLVSILTLLAGSVVGRELRPGLVKCDQGKFLESQAEFNRLRAMRRQDVESVTQDEFRWASARLIAQAEACYQETYGEAAYSGQKIDDGGIWSPPPDSPIVSSTQVDGSLSPQHNLQGTKWGAGSPFFAAGDHLDAIGPHLPGGEVTYSFMPNGVSIVESGTGFCSGGGCTNTSLEALVFSDSGGDTEPARCVIRAISESFAAWSAVADVSFTPVTDNGAAFDAMGASGDIRIGMHTFDGPSNILAHAFYPPPNGTSQAGDIHFDIAEAWTCERRAGGIDFNIVALHEIGHAIGLRHEPTDIAIMNASYDPAFAFGPLADDIIGAGEIYGGSPLGKAFFFGDVGIGTDEPSSSLHIQRTDGSAQIRIEDLSATAATRLQFEMSNKGGVGFDFVNRNRNSSWGLFLNNAQVPGVTISRLGTGVFEFLFEEDGDMTIQGTLTQLSDRNAKRDLVRVEPQDVLSKVVALPILEWTYKADRQAARHVGPTAQDFYSRFGLGSSRLVLAPSDLSGVALAAIQGLSEQLREQQEQIGYFRSKLEEQTKQMETLRARLETLERQSRRVSP